MTLGTIYHTISSALASQYGHNEACAIARLVLEEWAQATMTDILLDRPAPPPPLQGGWPAVIRRLEQGEPVQYLLGSATFCGHRISVAPGVLIPRPETEWLASPLLLPDCATEEQPPRILDVCTGSGCIALSIKHLSPEASVEAWDISPQALAIASDNFRHHRLNITTRQVDLLNQATWPAVEGFDLIVSNPPYVLQREKSSIAPHVLHHEPHLALFVPDHDPLLFYRPLAQLARRLLRSGGTLAVECNTALTTQVATLFTQCGLSHATVHPDCYSHPRFVTANIV